MEDLTAHLKLWTQALRSSPASVITNEKPSRRAVRLNAIDNPIIAAVAAECFAGAGAAVGRRFNL